MLKGIRVVELSTLIAAPYCGMVLGELGAEVIKIEHPTNGDFTRALGPPFIGNQSSLYLSVNRYKKSLGLNIRKKEGLDIFMRLIKDADVFIENFRPDTGREIGIDYNSVKKTNDRLIHCSITAFGDSGPYSSKAGSDTTIQGIGGIMTISGEEGDPPIRIGITPADMTAGIFAAFGILVALYDREKTGKGQKVSVSLLDALIALQSSRITECFATGKNPTRTGRASPFVYPAEFFETRDGYINISVVSNKFWRRLCTVLRIENLLEEPRFKDYSGRSEHREDLRKVLSKIFKEKTTVDWREILDRKDIPNGPIYSYSEMLSDPQVIHNEMIVELNHAKLGRLKAVRQPVRFSKKSISPKSFPPMLGEDSANILSSLRFSNKEIEQLSKKKIIS